ncbi:hypothetical protein [Kineococcus sp. SYSU DK018]|uniref:hypothetical protein n=1 Tax=Kineococcus sp. SYSU DK018 TaxID=3383139 RepID=UPI003D7CE5A6
METLSTLPAHRSLAGGPVLDLRDSSSRDTSSRDPGSRETGSLEALRDAYAERLALFGARAPAEELARNAQLVRSLEAALRPAAVRLRRSGPDPAIFLG